MGIVDKLPSNENDRYPLQLAIGQNICEVPVADPELW